MFLCQASADSAGGENLQLLPKRQNIPSVPVARHTMIQAFQCQQNWKNPCFEIMAYFPLHVNELSKLMMGLS